MTVTGTKFCLVIILAINALVMLVFLTASTYHIF